MKTSIKYLFPPEAIHQLPTWRFVLHFRSPRFFASRAARKALTDLSSISWKAISFSRPLSELGHDKSSGCLSIFIEVPEARRAKPNSLDDYESDVWKIYGNVARRGFTDLFYEAVDWRDPDGET